MQQEQAAAFGPLHIVDEHQQRRLLGQPGEEARHVVEDALPLGFWEVDDGWKVMLEYSEHGAMNIVRGLTTRGEALAVVAALKDASVDAKDVRGMAVASFSLAPDAPPRPGTRTPIEGLLLAGDWIETGLPATIEGALRSGHNAASLALGRGLVYGAGQ